MCRVSVLGIYTTEDYALTIDGYSTICDGYFAETIFCSKCHFLLVVGIELCHFYGLVVGGFSGPCFEIRKIVEGYIKHLHGVAFGKGKGLCSLSYLLTFRRN